MLQSPPQPFLYGNEMPTVSTIHETFPVATPTSAVATCRGFSHCGMQVEDTAPMTVIEQLEDKTFGNTAEPEPTTAVKKSFSPFQDHSNPLDRKYYLSCVKAATAFLESVERGKNNKDKLSTTTPKKPSTIVEESHPAPSLDNNILQELTIHVDALKDLCSGPNASFITVNQHQHQQQPHLHNWTHKNGNTTPKNGAGGRSTSTPSLASAPTSGQGFQWGAGGGSNVLTFASAAFTLEQQIIQDEYAEELAESRQARKIPHDSPSVTADPKSVAVAVSSADTDNASSSNDNERLQMKPTDPCSSLSTAQLDAVALIDITSSSSKSPNNHAGEHREENNKAADFNGTTSTNTASPYESATSMIDDGSQSIDMPIEAICTLTDNEVPPQLLPGPRTMMERQLLKVVCSMCEFAATVAEHTIRFTLQFPTKPVEQRRGLPPSTQRERREHSTGSLGNSQVSASASYAPPPPFPAAKESSRSGSIDSSNMFATTAPPTVRQQLPHMIQRQLSSTTLLPPESPTSPNSFYAQQRYSSAIFEDSALARGSLSELTAELLYHSLSILCDGMSVFKGDTEHDRVIEMLEHYLDRCESALQGVIPLAGPSTTLTSVMPTALPPASTAAAKSPNTNVNAASSKSGIQHHISNGFPQISSTATATAMKPTSLTYMQQCVIAARRERCKRLLAALYPFRRRVQMHLCDQLQMVTSYLPLVFGGVSRDTELTWFAEGFRTQHMQLLANLVHNNRHVSKAVALQKFPNPLMVACSQLNRSAIHSVTNNTNHAPIHSNHKVTTSPQSPYMTASGSVGLGTALNSPLFSSAVPSTVFAIPSAELSPPISEVHVDPQASCNFPPLHSERERSISSSSPKLPTSSPQQQSTTPPDLYCAVLQSTGLDWENPAISEWAEFAIKCMCSVSLVARNRFQLLKQRVVEGSGAGEDPAGGGGHSNKWSYHNTYQDTQPPSPPMHSNDAIPSTGLFGRYPEPVVHGANSTATNKEEGSKAHSGCNHQASVASVSMSYNQPTVAPNNISKQSWVQYEENFM